MKMHACLPTHVSCSSPPLFSTSACTALVTAKVWPWLMSDFMPLVTALRPCDTNLSAKSKMLLCAPPPCPPEACPGTAKAARWDPVRLRLRSRFRYL